MRGFSWLLLATALVAGATCLGYLSGPSGGADPPRTTFTLPAYGAGQAPVPPGPSPLEQRLTAMDAKLDRLLKLLEDAAAATPPGQGEASAALISGATRCAGCHDVKIADEKGGGLTLFTEQGTFVAMTPRLRQQLTKRLTTEEPTFKMPPPKSGIILTPEEKAALLAAFQDLPKKEGPP